MSPSYTADSNIHQRRTSEPSTPAGFNRQLHLPSSHLGAFLTPTPLSSPTVARAEQMGHHSTPRPTLHTRRVSSSGAQHPLPTSSLSSTPTSRPGQPLNLSRLSAGVVPSRTGSVLSRGLILKADFRFIAPSPSLSSPTPASASEATASSSGLNLSGATNFRDAGLGVWGVAQPTVTGVRSVLAVLRGRESRRRDGRMDKGCEVAWFVTREEPILYIGGHPYVLREASHPTRTYSISDRAENLEEIESRLKQDIIRESARYGGLILVHSESLTSGALQPTWISTDDLLTIRELFSSLRDSSNGGYNVTYHRTPVARNQSPNDGYLDVYTSLVSRIPTTTSLVFNCGAGVVRSTFAMSVALIVRRKQIIEEGGEDPYAIEGAISSGGEEMSAREVRVRGAEKVLRAQSEQAGRDRSLLRLMHVLAKCLPTRSQGNILTLLSTQPSLLENLRSALLGNFDIILSLLSCLDDGVAVKRVVDAVVDSSDAMVNLRESILTHRARYASLALSDSSTAADQRSAALAALERYFFLVTFAAFVSESTISSPTFTTTMPSSPPLTSSTSSPPPQPQTPSFSTWLKKRGEISRMISRMRKRTGGETATAAGFYVFSPVHDLSAIAKGEVGAAGAGVVSAGGGGGERKLGEGEVGDEWAGQIIRSRSGIILRSGMVLKADQWLTLAEGQKESQVVRGAINFRRVPGSLLYGLSQPTEEGIRRTLETVKADLKPGAKIVWVGVREEPLTTINGTPYVLRQQAVSLRNVKSYSGISSTRLELLESRLKDDVLSELSTFEGRILVSTEAEGSVTPVWETIASAEEEGGVGSDGQVKTLREVMDAVGKEVCGEKGFRFIRVPITAEASPDFHDLREIVQMVTELDMNESAIVVNDQLGRGRATRTLVIIKILQDWIRNNGQTTAPPSQRASYTVINNLLRVVRNGFEVKNAVDAAITACGEPFDLLESIENARQQAEDSEGETREKWIARGVRELRAYFFLILFMTFLNESKPSTWNELGRTASYEDFVRSRPVFRTIEKELDNNATIDALVPLQRASNTIGLGSASNDEVADFVSRRDGRILSAFTLLKSDFFSGLQKMSLPERVEGAPNFRRVPLSIAGSQAARTPASASTTSLAVTPGLSMGPATTTQGTSEVGPLVYGSGMPTVEGLRRALEKMKARTTRVFWSGMREEPVLYVGGRPHVLRLFNQPLENVITTGVTTATVEGMEAELKRDLLREREKTSGKVLLHDEIEEDGRFTITAMWEEVGAADILTPREVFGIMQKEGFKVDYDRLPVTDEQAPIPGIFSRLEQRVSSALEPRREGRADGEGRESVSFTTSCQMGRGRTTTGMVAIALVHRILFSPTSTGGASMDLAASFLAPMPHAENDQLHAVHWDGREAEPYLGGEYKIVLQLVGVLGQGKVAKRLTDRAIDDCEAVQNLREAVYAFKLRVEAAEERSKKREKLFEQALNYLYRYATLICFANFLLDKASYRASFSSSSSSASSADSDDEDGQGPEERASFPSFEDYLRERTEIRKILSRRTLD